MSDLGDGATSCGAGASSVETRQRRSSSNVGKRTLLSRLLLIDFPDTSDLSTGILWWAIGKYYTADLSIWTAHLDEQFSIRSMPIYKQLDALAMVFDMSDEYSFTALQGLVHQAYYIIYRILCLDDKCLLVDGDIQGIDRLYGALSAHMWPGMILKSGNKTTNPSLLSYIYSLFFYLLPVILELNPSCSSAGMFLTVSAYFFLLRTNLNSLFFVFVSLPMTEFTDDEIKYESLSHEQKPRSNFEQEELESDVVNTTKLDEDAYDGLADLQRLTYEIGNIHDNFRLMPDSQRREMDPKLAMKTAATFGG
uniref:Uncharacterized protein n=2 Tax=Musa acuminata subsp. malaccensis TaxID=214687 RepID=A0A804I277_MUSAM